MGIIFDQYGYTDGETACANLKYRTSDTTTMWMYDAIKDHGCPVFKWERDTKKLMPLESVLASGEHPIVTYIQKLGTPPKRARVYHLNREGLTMLCKRAIIQGRKEKEALAILADLAVAVEAMRDEGSLKDVPALPVAQVPSTAVEDEDTDAPIILAAEIVEDTKLADLVDTPIYTWKKLDVILSTSFARHCGIPTKQLNRRIRSLKNSDQLIEGTDFAYLDQKLATAWCVVADCLLTEKETVRGVYLLTQVGVNKLAKHLNNERAAAHSDGVSLAAAVTQDLMRNGNSSSWLDATKITNVLQMLAEANNRHADIAERMEIAYKEAIETNKALLQVLENIPVKQKMMGLVSTVDEEKLVTLVQGIAEKTVAAKIYSGEEQIPDDLIGNRKRRRDFFPAISETIISRFLDSKRHESRSWGLQKEGRVLETKSYLREGMEQRQAEFFSEIVYVNKTNKYFKFNHPIIGNFEVMHTSCKDVPERTVAMELYDFAQHLNNYNATYNYSYQSRDIYEVPQISGE